MLSEICTIGSCVCLDSDTLHDTCGIATTHRTIRTDAVGALGVVITCAHSAIRAYAVEAFGVITANVYIGHL